MEGCHIQVDSLSVHLKTENGLLHVLDNISLTAEPGQLVGILGPSGAGKSTLLRTLCGLVQPSGGSLLLDGLSPVQARKMQWIGWIPQYPALLPNRNVLENIRLPLEITGRNPVISLDKILDMVYLSDFRDTYPAQLSGGMQQRVALARALSTHPKLLLMDEPFSALDELLREEMQIEFLRLHSQTKQTVFFVTHSVEEAALMADKIMILSPLPAKAKHTIEISYKSKRDMNLRVSKEYFASVKRIRELLKPKENGH
jgi:NitT/TauT family transport system ATP-binding protein